MAPEIIGFLIQAQQTGALLDQDRDRDEGQSLLDYWIAALYRMRVAPPIEGVLLPFDPAEFAAAGSALVCPFKGLTPYTERNASKFYGRQVFIEQACERMRVNPILVIAGPTGAGKTSVVEAGLVPALKGGGLPGSQAWHYFGLVLPGEDPLGGLMSSIRPELSALQRTAAIQSLRTDPSWLSENVRAFGPSLLVVDQFDDLFPDGNHAVAPDAGAFLDSLVHLMQRPDGQCRLVLIRSDRYLGPADGAEDEQAAVTQLGGLLLRNAYRVDLPDLGTRELRDAILQPAELMGLRFQDKDTMVSDLVRALVGIPVVPPLLQWVLLALWDARQAGVVTWDVYRRILRDPRRRRTNAGWAVANVAEQVFNAAADTPGQQAAIERSCCDW
jgi:hypothetical protein